MTKLEVLIAARKLIEDEKNWNEGTKLGIPGQLCALEALEEVLGIPHEWSKHRDHLWKEAQHDNPICFLVNAMGDLGLNKLDRKKTHKETLEVFDRAIFLAHSCPSRGEVLDKDRDRLG